MGAIETGSPFGQIIEEVEVEQKLVNGYEERVLFDVSRGDMNTDQMKHLLVGDFGIESIHVFTNKGNVAFVEVAFGESAGELPEGLSKELAKIIEVGRRGEVQLFAIQGDGVDDKYFRSELTDIMRVRLPEVEDKPYYITSDWKEYEKTRDTEDGGIVLGAWMENGVPNLQSYQLSVVEELLQISQVGTV